jgi:DUF based on E. rectale Gene description (DUF3880)
MEIRRVALIFDDKDRPETTGVYCRRALESLVEVVHFRADELAGIPRTGFDLYLNIDDGLEYQLPADLRPSAWWAIDTHLNFDWCRRKAKAFDFVFAAQRDGASRFEAEGIAPAEWLPLACDPEMHLRSEVDKVYDIAFVGNRFSGGSDRHLLGGPTSRRWRGYIRPRGWCSTAASRTTSICASSRPSHVDRCF